MRIIQPSYGIPFMSLATQRPESVRAAAAEKFRSASKHTGWVQAGRDLVLFFGFRVAGLGLVLVFWLQGFGFRF